MPKDASTGALRALLSARRSAVKAHTAPTNQIHALLVTAPAVLTAAKALAQRAEFLAHQKQDLTAHLDILVRQINPALHTPTVSAQTSPPTAGHRRHQPAPAPQWGPRAVRGGPRPSIFGKITRHRLSRGSDRAANNALYRIAPVRMSAHPQTRDYVQRQVANGGTHTPPTSGSRPGCLLMAHLVTAASVGTGASVANIRPPDPVLHPG